MNTFAGGSDVIRLIETLGHSSSLTHFMSVDAVLDASRTPHQFATGRSTETP
jgi:hypothetical protein